ncbi:MAG: hypothetical protein IJO48_00935, partial [Clostridia bacterium]|nr:hypothetical protein [Clostridia bacterium]
LSTVLKNSSALSNNAESDNMLLYRIINPTEWYIAYLTDVSSAQRTVEGATYTVTFDGYESTPYTAVAASPKVNDKKIVNILKVSGDIGDFVGIRSISATISTTASGIKLSAGLLDMRDGAAYVNVIIGDAVKSVEVNILASDSEYAIVEAKNPNDVLSAGMRCKKP